MSYKYICRRGKSIEFREAQQMKIINREVGYRLPVAFSAVLALAVLALGDRVAAQSADPKAPQSGTIESGKFQLDYWVEGVGNPAIVIGFPNYYGRVFSPGLRSRLQLVFVDHRGSAPSPGPVPVSGFTLDRISDDIELVRTNVLGSDPRKPLLIIDYSPKSTLFPL